MVTDCTSSNLASSVTDDGNDNSDFDIKVESNAAALPATVAVVENSTSDPTRSSPHQENLEPSSSPTELNQASFPLTTHILQEADASLQQLFGGEQFTVPVHQLSSADLQNLAKVTCNVLMSAAALPEDSKADDSNSIVIEAGEPKMIMLRQGATDFSSHVSSAAGLEIADTKSVPLPDDGKEYLVADLNPDLFIKSECSSAGVANPSENTGVKSELAASVSSTTSSMIVASTSNQQQVAFCVQLGGEGSQNQVFLTSSGQIVKPLTQHVVVPAGEKPVDLTELLLKPKPRPGRRSRKEVEKASELSNQKAPLRLLAPRTLASSNQNSLIKTTFSPAVGSVQNASVSSVGCLRPGVVHEASDLKGHYFEVLGRCVQCFRFSRTTSYCRSEKRHRETKAAPCLECEQCGHSTLVCRRKLNHKTPNALPVNLVINTALQRPEGIKEILARNMLPQCLSELQSIVVHHADISFATGKVKEEPGENEFGILEVSNVPVAVRKPTDYARGYLHPYSKEAWDAWLLKFCYQTGTNYRIRTGKRVNKRSDHGLANHNGNIVVYRTIETQLYNCALGGKPRKRKLKDGVKRRKDRGSKLVGCPAVIHTRLIETENHWCALEVTVPKILSHLTSHDPRVSSSDFSFDGTDLQVVQTQLSEADMAIPQQPSNPEILVEHLDVQSPTTVNRRNLSLQPRNPTLEQQKSIIDNNSINGPLKKQARNLFLNCANILNNVNNTELLQAIHDYAQLLYSQLLKASLATAASPPPNKRARVARTPTESTAAESCQGLNLPQL